MMCNCTLAGTSACKNCSNNRSMGVEYNPNYFKSETEINIPVVNKITQKLIWCEYCEGKLEGWEDYCPHCGAKFMGEKDEN